MNPVMKAIDEVKYNIPDEILRLVFVERSNRWRQTPESIDDKIMALVIRPRLLVDCSLLGGAEIYVPLVGLLADRVDDMTLVYRIPKTLTNGRSILSVLNITFSDLSRLTNQVSGLTGIAGLQQSMYLQAGNAVMDTHAALPITSTARVQLIGENTVMVKDSAILPPNVYLRCKVADDDNMNHLQLRSYRAFTKAAIYAVKAFIYNNRVVAMGQAELQGGGELGVIKSIIEGYADANELYETHLKEVLEKVLFMNDQESFGRFIKTIVRPNF
jgi:hypothetical protein